VLGHSGCGAPTTAVDVSLNPSDYLALATKHSLRSILDRTLLVVQASANKLISAFGSDVAHCPGYRKALIEASIVTNAALAAYSIQQEFVASELTELRAVYGIYLLETREVWAPRLGNIREVGLAAAPADLAGFADLSNAIVRSSRIASYLKLEK
jgi:carbonic anhydrase